MYDGYGFTEELGEDVAYEPRKKWIDENLPSYSKYYVEVQSELVYSFEEVETIYNKYIEDSQEGVMVRIVGSTYEHKRTNSLLKHKPVDSAEAELLNVEDGDGNWSGIAKVVTLKYKGKIFNGSIVGKKADAKKFLEEKEKHIGNMVTFLFNGFTGLGVPNYARVDVNNCYEGDKGNSDDEEETEE